MMLKKVLLSCFAALAGLTVQAQTSIAVEVRNIVEASERFNVTFTIEGESSPSDFQWDQGPDFQVIWGPQKGTSTNFSIVGGKSSKSVRHSYTYVLTPLRVGKFTLPAATATVKGKTISSKTVEIEVVGDESTAGSRAQGGTDAAAAGSGGGISAGDLFIRFSVGRTELIAGEPFTATIKLYSRVDIAGFEDARFPAFNGFWSQETEVPTTINFEREVVDGQIYNSALIRRYVLIPQQTGQVTIDPAELVCLVNVRVPRRSGSIFDGFFDDNIQRVRRRIVSSPVTVNVKPLPAGAPASFGGGVGSISMKASLSRDSLSAHDAASLTVTLSGSGNIALLQAPKLSFPPDFEVYDIKSSSSQDRAGGIGGSKTFEFPFIPRSHGDFIIGPVEYSYYDTSRRSYVTLRSDALPLHVEKARLGTEDSRTYTGTPAVEKRGVKVLGEDIRYIRTAAPSLVPGATYLVSRKIFYVLIVGIVLLFLAACSLLVITRRRNSDVSAVRGRTATRMAMKRLHEVKGHLDKNESSAFYEQLHRALLGFASDKLALDAGELDKGKIEAAFVAASVPEALALRYTALLDACEYARYAPAAGTPAMSGHYGEAVDVISSIDSCMKHVNHTAQRGAALGIILMLLWLCPMSAGGAPASGDDFGELWDSAVTAYGEGRWDDAIRDFEALHEGGIGSAVLLTNLGNAYFKGGYLPEAILNYERALKADPSYDDARFNLEFANSQTRDRIDSVPEFVLVSLVRNLCYLMPSDAWAVLSLIMLALALAALLAFLLSRVRSRRRTGFYLSIVFALFFALSLSMALRQWNDYHSSSHAIIMNPVVSASSSPGASSTSLFVVHEGTRVEVLESVGDYSLVELSDGRRGWVREKEIEVI